MKVYLTQVKAIDPLTEQVCIWAGPYISAPSQAEAQSFCDENGLGYCEVIGEAVEEVDLSPADWIMDICWN